MNTSTFFQSRTIGWTAISMGCLGISGLILGLTFTFVENTAAIIYNLSDFFNLVIGILSGMLAWMLYSRFREKMTSSHRFLLYLVLGGMVLMAIGFWLIASDRTGWILSGWYTDTGFAFIGLWLTGLNYTAWQNELLPKGLSILGIIAGVLLVLGFSSLPGLIRNVDSMAFMSPILNGIWNASILGWVIIHPVWCITLGLHMRKLDK